MTDYIEKKLAEMIPEYSSLALLDEDCVDGYRMVRAKEWLRTALEEALLKGLETAEDAAEELHKELNLKARMPGGALEREIHSQDKILHSFSSRLAALKMDFFCTVCRWFNACVCTEGDYGITHQRKLGENLGTGASGHIHESDGAVYMSNPPQYRCKICGQFRIIQTAPPITWN